MIKEKIYDATTGEEIIIEFTKAELSEYKAKEAEVIAMAEAENQAIAEKEAARKSALEKLAALGLTEAEIQALAN